MLQAVGLQEELLLFAKLLGHLMWAMNSQLLRIEEIVWVKTNQLQRIIRTGRTGHWILGVAKN